VSDPKKTKWDDAERKEADEIGRRAAKWYEKKRHELEVQKNLGCYVVIDSDSGDAIIGNDEDEAERRFIEVYGSARKAVLFHIGRF
jgi:hypothetical protein